MKGGGSKKAGGNRKPHYRKKAKVKKPEFKPTITRREPAVIGSSGDLGHHVLAAYYNDARRNILLCLNDICLKMGFREEENESKILEILNRFNLSGTVPEKQDELIEHLRYRFGFLNVLTDNPPPVPPKIENIKYLSAEEAGQVRENHSKAIKEHQEKKKKWKENLLPLPAYYEAHLSWMLSLIRDLRNTTTHPTEPEETISFTTHRRFYHALRKIYESSFHTVKSRFGHTTATMEPFKRSGADGKVKILSEFSLCLCADPRERLDKDNELPQSQVIYDFGHVLFCALFLEKNQSAELINKFWDTAEGSKWSVEERTIIREMISVFRVRLPLQRLKSDDTPATVTMDTLSELSRCPRPLLDMLSPEDKNLFRGEPGAGVDEDGEPVVLDAENTYLFARSHDDRFVRLMMRFFDFNRNNRIRFAIDLGQFYYNVRLKPAHHFADHRPRVRRLSQKVLGYGRLLDYETADKPQDWLQLEANYPQSKEEENELLDNAGQSIQPLRPYIVQTYPHYHYFDDKIGFRIAPPSGGKVTYPDLKAGKAASEKGALFSPRAEEMQPEYWMSREQMLHLAFYSFLEQKVAEQTFPALNDVLLLYRRVMSELFKDLRDDYQEEIQSKITGAPDSNERKQSIQALLNNRVQESIGNLIKGEVPQSYAAFIEIPYTALPKVIIQHLLGAQNRKVAVKEIIDRARHLLDRTEARQKRLRDQLQMAKKRGQKGFRAVKCGPIGDFIAEDLMRFQPVDGNEPDGGKINSQHYQILQKTLAYYGAHTLGKDLPEIVALLKAAGLLSGAFKHPFLSKLNLESQPERYKGLIDFYEAYLQARGAYLKQWIREHEQRSELNHLPHWLRMRTPSTLASWLEEQLKESGGLKHPLPLAKNMLYGLILRMMADVLDISPQQLEQEGEHQFQNAEGKNVVLKPSVTWLVKRYLAADNDESQQMYRAYECYDEACGDKNGHYHNKRYHKLFDTYLDKRTQRELFNEKSQHYLSESERIEEMVAIRALVDKYHPKTDDELKRIENQLADSSPKAFRDSSNAVKAVKLRGLIRAYKRDEQRVRYSVSQDMLLFLSASHYLGSLQLSESQERAHWRLGTIETTLLKTKINYRLAAPGTGKWLEHQECKIRDRGKLSLLVRDRRLTRLMQYYPEDEAVLNHTEIRSELAAYGRAKVNVMEQVHTLEKLVTWGLGNVVSRTESEKESSQKYFGKGRHGDYLYKLYRHMTDGATGQPAVVTEQSFQNALNIRNAFSHNQYPKLKGFRRVAELVRTESVPKNLTVHRKVAERLQDELERIYQPWIDYLNERVKHVVSL